MKQLGQNYFLTKKLLWIKADKFFIDGYGSIHRKEKDGVIYWVDYQRDITYTEYNDAWIHLEDIYKNFLDK